MKKQRNLFIIAILFISVVFSSCITVPITVTSSTTPLHDKKIGENLGKTKGSDLTGSVFCLWMVRRPDIDKAIERALKKKGGDALINVTCYEESMYFILFSLTKVIVEGEAVKFAKETDKSEEKNGKKNNKIRRQISKEKLRQMEMREKIKRARKTKGSGKTK